jgi:hypothetical protein
MGQTTPIGPPDRDLYGQLVCQSGVDVVIDDFCWPPNFAEYYAALFENPAVHRILLLPTQVALTERITKRGGPFADVFVKNTPYIYSYLNPMPKEDWIVLDSSDWTIEQTVQEPLARIGTIRSFSAPSKNAVRTL